MNKKACTLIVLLATAPQLTSCARAELARAQEARTAYLECLDEFPREPERCDDLRSAMNREYDRYDAVAEERARNWRDDEKLPN